MVLLVILQPAIESTDGPVSTEPEAPRPSKTKADQDLHKAAAPHLSPTKEKLNRDLQKAIERAEKVLSTPSSPAKTVEAKAKQESLKLMLKDFNKTQVSFHLYDYDISNP